MKLISVFIATLLLSVSAFADTCFNSYRVSGFNAVSDRELIVDAGRQEYRVELFFCRELRWADRIAFDSFGGSSRVCRGDKVLVLDNFSNRIIDRCTIDRITLVESE